MPDILWAYVAITMEVFQLGGIFQQLIPGGGIFLINAFKKQFFHT
jgi:hypothetical protein